MNRLMKKGKRGAGLSLILALCACQPAVPTVQVLEGHTMGTSWRVSLSQTAYSSAELAQLRQQIQRLLDGEEAEFSTWRADSLLSRFNAQNSTAPQPISPAIAAMVRMALRVGRQTGGAMDITIAPLVALWGFGPQPAPSHLPDAQAIRTAKARTGLDGVRVISDRDGDWLQKKRPELQLDLSTVGEGYAADQLAAFLQRQGVEHYLVAVGGAVFARGERQPGQRWRIAIQQPTDRQTAAQAVVTLRDYGISTAGSYHNYYTLDGRRLSHIIDPRSGYPVQHTLVSATVIAPTTLEADAWDTGLLVLGMPKAQALALRCDLAAYLIARQADGTLTVWASPRFQRFLRANEQNMHEMMQKNADRCTFKQTVSGQANGS